ncbi:hypothetical protein TI05_01615, partial [Achromatium sp. WMS3]
MKVKLPVFLIPRIIAWIFSVIVGIYPFVQGFNSVSIPTYDQQSVLNKYLINANFPLPNAETVEQQWMQEFATNTTYLPAPLGPLPCPRGTDAPNREQVQAAIDLVRNGNTHQAIAKLKPLVNTGSPHWLPVLTITILQATAGQYANAKQQLDTFFAQASNRISMSKSGGMSFAGRLVKQGDTQSIALTHLVYNRGALWLQQEYYNKKLIKILQHGVGTFRRSLGWRSEENLQQATILAPGCPHGNDHALAVSSVYNNLVVGYILTNRSYSRGHLRRETIRKYNDDPSTNPLQSLLIQYRNNRTIPSRLLLALSNAERVIHGIGITNLRNAVFQYNLRQLLQTIDRYNGLDSNNLQSIQSQLLTTVDWNTIPQVAQQDIAMHIAKTHLAKGNWQIPPNITQRLASKYKVLLNARIIAQELRTKHRKQTVQEIVAGKYNNIQHALNAQADIWIQNVRKDIITHLTTTAQAIRNKPECIPLFHEIRNLSSNMDINMPGLNHLCTLRINSYTSLNWLADWIASWSSPWYASLGISIIAGINASFLWFIIPLLILLWVITQAELMYITFNSLYHIENKAQSS